MNKQLPVQRVVESTPTITTASADVSEPGWLDLFRRFVLASTGILCVALGALGVILPGLPTTIFLLAACYLFTRSFPKLERILVRNRFFAAFHRYLDGSVEMPLRAKIFTLLIMWSFITVSTLALWYREEIPRFVALLVPAAGLVGTFFILQYGKKSVKSRSQSSMDRSQT